MSERIRILQGDVLDRLRDLPDASVHCVVTSPPYWSLRDYNTDGQIGLEERLDCLGWANGEPCGICWVCRMIAVFREVKRVLRPDGVCWVNLGDSYSGGGNSGKETAGFARSLGKRRTENLPQGNEIPAKNLCGQPWRAALALHADGWYLRSDVIWSKVNPMPESVTDRPAKAHEYLFMLTKSARYYYDADAVREIRGNELSADEYAARTAPGATWQSGGLGEGAGKNKIDGGGVSHPNGRNLRSVWSIPSEPCPAAHFATYPQALVRPCVLASTSEKGCCPTCGAGWKRTTKNAAEYDAVKRSGGIRSNARETLGLTRGTGNPSVSRAFWTTGWQPSCKCPHTETDLIPAIVLDPFSGSGTTGLVALALGRNYVGIELNPAYIEISRKRLECVVAQEVLRM